MRAMLAISPSLFSLNGGSTPGRVGGNAEVIRIGTERISSDEPAYGK